ncbi:hypothetical protein HZS_4692 [Henneguya salminicola]|nr:hypothetical protein HZS_4692 [Henneguya salminicola]
MYELCLCNTYLLNDDDAANRTNNAHKRYNCSLNDPFLEAHLYLAYLIQIIKSESVKTWELF